MVEEDAALERAKERVKELKDFYGHLGAYVVAMTAMIIADVAGSSAGTDAVIGLHWAYWPLFIWGAVVLIHGVQVFFPRRKWEDRTTQKYYEQERQRDIPQH